MIGPGESAIFVWRSAPKRATTRARIEDTALKIGGADTGSEVRMTLINVETTWMPLQVRSQCRDEHLTRARQSGFSLGHWQR